MLGEERHNTIVNLVEQYGSITVQELMNHVDASESTLRRDLNILDSEGRLIKVHGGAMAKTTAYQTTDDDVNIRKSLNIEEKIAIARYAAGLVSKNDIIFLDAGTTTELMIDYIMESDVMFVTNAMTHAKKLAQKGFETDVLASRFKSLTESVVGEETIMGLDKYNFTKGFFGTNGVTVKNGFTTPDIKEALVKKKAIEKTKEVYILSDSSKFSQISAVTFGKFDEARIITCKNVDNSFRGYKNVLEVE